MEIREHEPLAPYTTFNIGGPAKWFVEATTHAELREAIQYAHDRHLPYFVLAGGSNLLIADDGFDGLVVRVTLTGAEIDTAQHRATFDAGYNLRAAIDITSEAGLGGWEAMYGIPGTVGGAVRGNAGAFGTEIQDVLIEVDALNTETLEERTFTNEQCTFAYRTSFFKQHPEWIVIRAVMQLQPSDPRACRERAQETLELRQQRQIQDIRSGGSFFTNPAVGAEIQKLFEEEKGEPAREGRVPAGWLIEKSGFKDVCENDVCTGTRSANYLINAGGATAADVRAFADKIKNAVRDQFGVELVEEVMLLGFTKRSG